MQWDQLTKPSVWFKAKCRARAQGVGVVGSGRTAALASSLEQVGRVGVLEPRIELGHQGIGSIGKIPSPAPPVVVSLSFCAPLWNAGSPPGPFWGSLLGGLEEKGAWSALHPQSSGPSHSPQMDALAAVRGGVPPAFHNAVYSTRLIPFSSRNYPVGWERRISPPANLSIMAGTCSIQTEPHVCMTPPGFSMLPPQGRERACDVSGVSCCPMFTPGMSSQWRGMLPDSRVTLIL